MANPEDAVEVVVAVPGTSKLAIFPLIIAVIAATTAAILLLAGTAYLLVKSGRLALPLSNPSTVKAHSAMPVTASSTHAMVLEPMVANLADADGKAFLRIGLTLRVVDALVKKDDKTKEEKVKGLNEAEAAVRDVALEVFGRQTSESLLATNGKEHLKAELKFELAKRDPDLKVADIFLTEFLVQR
jgi:flagellar FliL protein